MKNSAAPPCNEDLRLQIPCQSPKYQPVTDILNPLGLGVKVSYTILDIFKTTGTTVCSRNQFFQMVR